MCESISPGSTVAFERSMTFASAGIAVAPSVTFSIRSPLTKMSWFVFVVALTPSIRFPARITVSDAAAGASLSACPRALNVSNDAPAQPARNDHSQVILFIDPSPVSHRNLRQSPQACNTWSRCRRIPYSRFPRFLTSPRPDNAIAVAVSRSGRFIAGSEVEITMSMFDKLLGFDLVEDLTETTWWTETIFRGLEKRGSDRTSHRL